MLGGLSDSMTGVRGTIGNSCTAVTNPSSASATLNSIGSSAYGHTASSVTTNTSALERSLAASYGGGTSVGSGSGSRGIDGIGSSIGHSTSIGMSSSSGIGTGSTGNTGGSTVTWAPTPTGHQQGTEIDRIMAKIEQARLSIANDNRILAELEHPRTTGPIMSSALGTGGLTSVSTSLGLSSHQSHLHQTPSSLASQISSSAMLGGLSGLTGATTGLGMNSIGLGGSGPGAGAGVSSAMAAGISSITGGVSSMGVTSSTSSHALTDGQYSGLTSSTGGSSTNHYSTNANVSPLPSRANPMSTTMPPLCQPLP
ncbi:AGAP013187-PA [Anopheles gambiae str. PEST]|uniref:AGAP013187-PA n=1 Tax=Anopheles gambiae TaxID=7165 RepID=F5HJ81_ANOGA|nr:AGAP013187-PA [Anopheles gambiae str. PEST]